jgi:hypothetical protein
MLQDLVDHMRDVLPPQLEADASYVVRRARPWLSRLRLLDYELLHLAPKEGSKFSTAFWGRRKNAWHSWLVLGLPGDVAQGAGRLSLTGDATVFISELPFPGALQIPWEVHMNVPIRGQTLSAVEGRMNSNARRQIKAGRSECRVQRVTEAAAIDRLNDTMLIPYARNRHGAAARIMPTKDVHRIAGKGGRLDVLLWGEEEIACHLGQALRVDGRRVWSTRLFGYPESVFADPKRLPEMNALNPWFALRYAHENGFDAYDMGACIANPDDGLLQWKRRRGGEPSLMRNDGCFYLRLPSAHAEAFLWESPLFAQEGDDIDLHVGIPHDKSDDEVQQRLHTLVIPGMKRLHLHMGSAAGTTPAITRFRASYEKNHPDVAVHVVNDT